MIQKTLIILSSEAHQLSKQADDAERKKPSGFRENYMSDE